MGGARAGGKIERARGRRAQRRVGLTGSLANRHNWGNILGAQGRVLQSIVEVNSLIFTRTVITTPHRVPSLPKVGLRNPIDHREPTSR